MFPRPPPKITLKHEWKRELGSEVDRQPEKEVARQPDEVVRQENLIPNNSGTDRCDLRTRKIEETQSVPKRSMFLLEELSSSDRTGRLVETEVIQTRSFEGSKSLNGEQTHERTGRLVTALYSVEAQDRTSYKIGKSIADQDESHETMMVYEADMDFRLPGLPDSVVKHA